MAAQRLRLQDPNEILDRWLAGEDFPELVDYARSSA
jgi:hypothetical protein